MVVKFDPYNSDTLENHMNYSIGDLLLKKKHPLLEEYLTSKICEMEEILSKINITSESAKIRSEDIKQKINELRSVLDGSVG